MNSTRHSVVAGIGAALIVIASLLIAVATSDDGLGSDDIATVFLGFLGFGGFISGIGLVIAAAASYLRRPS